MKDIIERLEKATGPDRELDARLHCAREGLEFVLFATGGEVYGDICDPSDSGFGGRNTCTSGYLYARYPDEKNPPTLGGGKRGNKVQGCRAPRYTASIDAAMTLVPEGCGWRIWSPAADSNQRHRATTWAARGKPMFAPFDVEAASAPLALCIAALKAREFVL